MHKQQGLSIVVFLLCCIIGLLVVWLGFQIVPAYTEYRSVMTAVRNITADSKAKPAAPEFSNIAAIQKYFDKQADLTYITSLKGEDLEISKEGGSVIITFSYDKKIKLIGNSYLGLAFSGDSRN